MPTVLSIFFLSLRENARHIYCVTDLYSEGDELGLLERSVNPLCSSYTRCFWLPAVANTLDTKHNTLTAVHQAPLTLLFSLPFTMQIVAFHLWMT